MEIKGTKDSPFVSITNSPKKIVMEGVLMPENAYDFFIPIHESVKAILGNSDPLEVHFEIVYLNSMSNKQILKLLKDIETSGIKCDVIWKYKPTDRLMKMKGMELSILCPDISIELQEVN